MRPIVTPMQKKKIMKKIHNSKIIYLKEKHILQKLPLS